MYTTPTMEMYEASAAYIRERMTGVGLGAPVLAVILGSGLGAYAASDAVVDRMVIPYRDIPNFPTSTVSYQKGELVIGRVGEKTEALDCDFFENHVVFLSLLVISSPSSPERKRMARSTESLELYHGSSSYR